MMELNHPNLVLFIYIPNNFNICCYKVKCLGWKVQEQWEYWIGMEFMDGGDLASLFQRNGREKGLEQSVALSLAKDILEGLKYLHGKNIIHRDIKPANILLTTSHSGILTAKVGGNR